MFCDYRLKVFYTVALKGSFTAAAKELGITQPAVSNHIAELEGDIGDLLFQRSRKETVLTDKGKILFSYSEKILHLYKCAYRELIPGHHEDPKHSLTIVAETDISRHILKELVSHYQKIHPNAHVSILERSHEEASSLISSGNIDLAFTDKPWQNMDSIIFATLNIHGAHSPMRTYYFSRSKDNENAKVIDEFLLCCKTFR